MRGSECRGDIRSGRAIVKEAGGAVAEDVDVDEKEQAGGREWVLEEVRVVAVVALYGRGTCRCRCGNRCGSQRCEGEGRCVAVECWAGGGEGQEQWVRDRG